MDNQGKRKVAIRAGSESEPRLASDPVSQQSDGHIQTVILSDYAHHVQSGLSQDVYTHYNSSLRLPYVRMCYDCRNQIMSCFSGVSMTSRAGTVSITYKSSPDRRTVVINGAVGGILSGPEVVVDLYVERGSLPDVTQEFDAQGKPIPGTELPIDRYSKIREIQTTVVLNPEMAIGLGQYLIRLGEQAQSQYGMRNL